MKRRRASRNPDGETEYHADEGFAGALDAQDPLAAYRERFHLPRRPDGPPAIYFAGMSLGLQPRAVRTAVEQELEDWARLAVDAHFEGRNPWYSYHEQFRAPGARLVGALPHEVVFMNGLTVNLHLMLVSFYRPTPQRYRVLMEDCEFPSDTYAARTQVRWHGFDPDDAILVVRPRQGEHTLRIEDIEALLDREGERIALVLLSGVNYVTGQVLDMPRIAAAARRRGCIVGFDLAHAAGNVPLRLHEWDVDFGVWCTYKYLNAGPGCVAGCFVHERHARDVSLLRFGGWWGNDPATRFRMHLQPEFVAVPSADGWQLSNPPILSMAALRASLGMFDEVGMERLRAKSVLLTGYLRYLLEEGGMHSQGAPPLPGAGDRPRDFEIITPRQPSARGCQVSILVHRDPQGLQKALKAAGVVCDFRPPHVLRVAPVPLYNTFHEVWRFARVLQAQA